MFDVNHKGEENSVDINNNGKKSPQKCLKESLDRQSQSSCSHSFFPLKVLTAAAVAKAVVVVERAVACLKKRIYSL